jgi:hypothetical protein
VDSFFHSFGNGMSCRGLDVSTLIGVGLRAKKHNQTCQKGVEENLYRSNLLLQRIHPCCVSNTHLPPTNLALHLLSHTCTHMPDTQTKCTCAHTRKMHTSRFNTWTYTDRLIDRLADGRANKIIDRDTGRVKVWARLASLPRLNILTPLSDREICKVRIEGTHRHVVT